ncbi:PP2C family protein-serine/threonine phosphatase [Loktanella sp. Alg231-35]|uniref:PP2C family protein-serine/threonine phosphatase n=1 Tax=Loktanella sp. Alg231-35 TaxID=1922220 RepID=UPI000D554F85|nr:protein phosphatase 2C domain-containing protein [Loktanella sp. Alg231-35]
MLDGRQVCAEVLSFDVSTVALKGARDYQEDSFISNFALGQDTGFAVLADGMGGHTSGHVASTLVVSEMFAQLKIKDQMLDEGVLNIPSTLETAAEAANARVSQHVSEDDEAHGMGATLLSVVIRQEKLFWISVGDSPLLLFRDGALRQLNKDHSMAPEIDMMVKAGAMSEEVGRDHPDRNTLTSAITGGKIRKIDCPEHPVTLLPDDILIVASDGIQYLSNEVIARTLKQTQSGRSVDIANALVEEIEELNDPEQDNTACLIFKVSVSLQEQPIAVDIVDKPVLATAPEKVAERKPSRIVRIVPKKPKAEELAVEERPEAQETSAFDVEEEHHEDALAAGERRKAYWYRGQRFYKD